MSRINKIFQTITPVTRSGVTLVPPNWRFEAVFNPAKYKLKQFVNRNISDGSSCLRRYLGIGLPYDINYKMSSGVKTIYNQLTENNKSLFLAIWNRRFKRSRRKKILVSSNPSLFQKNPVWNIGVVPFVNDQALRKLILHYSNFKYDKHIAYALELGRNQEYNEIFRFIGYCIFAQIPITKIALRWNIPIKHVEAVKDIFFDFSYFPKDRMALFSHLRQLTSNGLFSELDFVYYKRVFELGELGLKAQTDFYSLTSKEKQIVEEFLGKSIIQNALNLNFSIKDQKDAIQYGAVVSNLANYYIKNVEKAYFEAKIRNLDACTKRVEGDMTDNFKGMTELDLKYMALLTEHSLQDEKIEYKTLDMLK
jgi:hypothetical protein